MIKEITDEMVKAFIKQELHALSINPVLSHWEQFKASHLKEKERDWEVERIWITFHNDSPGIVADRSTIHNYLKGDEAYSSYEIYSVRRISDNEVFTVGDVCGHIYAPFYPITRFEIIPDGTMSVSGSNGKSGKEFKGFGCSLKSLKKVPSKPVLFTTEDGKEIFDGDYYYPVTHDFIRIGTNRANVQHVEKGFIGEKSNTKAFSTEAAAIEYVKENKTLFSLKEIKEVIRTVNNGAKGYDTRGFLTGQFNTIAELKIANKEG